MHFEQGHIYHIYNQGNNRQAIFFEREHYLFFLRKIKEFVCPYANVIAWCLMPNHFHLMVEVKELTLSDSLSQREAITAKTQTRTFNDSIGLMIRSYTQAINKTTNSHVEN